MNASLIWNNTLAYSLQIGLLVALAAVAPALLRLRLPGPKLVYWQTVLIACLLLPVARPWKRDVITIPRDAQTTVATALPGTNPNPAPRNYSPAEIGLFLLAAGILLRVGGLINASAKLRGYRRRSRVLDSAVSCQVEAWGAEAELRISPDVSGPVTFGFRRPVILLPELFTDLDEPTKDAILCHEVLHVRRHDWMFTLAEEFIRAIFWFHPAIWWLLGEAQLAREQAVDRAAVAMTGSRERYVDALLTIAGTSPQPDLAPAPLFLRKRHLRCRLHTLLKEVHMSNAKLSSVFAASVLSLAAAGWIVTGVIPLSAAPQLQLNTRDVTVETNGATLIHEAPLNYPPEAIEKKIEGTVVLQVKLDANGAVLDASVLSGPDELRKAALQSVLNWHFMKDAASSTRVVNVKFQLPEAAPAMAVKPVVAAVPGLANTGTGATVPLHFLITGLSDQAKSELLGEMPVHDGELVSDGPASAELIQRIGATVRAFDPDLSFRIIRGGRGGANTQTSLAFAISPSNGPVAIPAPSTAAGPQPMRVGANVQAANVVSRVRPDYPPLAKQARVQGTVTLAITIGTEGQVKDVQLNAGPPLLAQAAMDAVKQWTYKPTLLNGSPVEVLTTVDVTFTLAE